MVPLLIRKARRTPAVAVKAVAVILLATMAPPADAPSTGLIFDMHSSVGGGQVYGRLAVAWLSLSCGGFQICLVLITTSRFILNVGIGLIVE